MPLETDKSQGFKLALRDELKTGLYLDLFSRSVPLWQDGNNIQFTKLGVQKLQGHDVLLDIAEDTLPIRGLLQKEEDGVRVVYAGDTEILYRIDVDAATKEDTSRPSNYNLSVDAGGSVWDTGSSTWDSGSSVWDDGLVTASHWSMVNYGSFILATNGIDPPQLKKNSFFVDMPGGVTGITITAGGTGFVVGDTLTLTGGDGSGATAEVIAVSGGAITEVSIKNGGSGYTTVPTGFTTGEGGSGATFTFTVNDMDVNTIEIFVVRGPHILGFNTSYSDKEVVWCDADDVDTWVTASGNLAGSLELRELKSRIVAAVPLGSRIAVYGENQMFLLSYLGNELVFGYQPALDGIGAVSKHSVVAVGPRNFGLGPQGFFMTDGASFEYIGDPAVRDWFRDNAALGQISKAFAYHDQDNTQVRWYFPTTSVDITEGVAFNYQTNTWSRVTGSRSAGVAPSVLTKPITGSEGGVIYFENTGENEDGSAMTSWVRTKPLDIGDADRIKELDSIRIGFEGTGLQYRIGWSETETGTITWGDYTDMSTGFDFHNLRTAGRWLHMELYSATLNASWEVMSVEFIGRAEGTR